MTERYSIQPIRPDQAQPALAVMESVLKEIWNVTLKDVEAGNELEDFDDLQAYYFERGGLFLVALDGDEFIATGGVVPLDDQTCELKRIWLLKEYRGKGIGRDITNRLIQHAREKGYRQVVLQVYSPERQAAAVGLYTALGFKPVPQYEAGSDCALAMRLELDAPVK